MERLLRIPNASSYTSLYPHNGNQVILRQQEKHAVLWFSGMLLTTICTIFLMISEFRGVTFSGSFYNTATQNRAAVQIVVQIISGLLGTLQVAALSRAFNYATRLRITRAVPTASLQFWASISHHSLKWALPIHHLLPLILFLIVCSIPSALWAGAISPVVTTAVTQATLGVPVYNNISSIREWPPQVGTDVPTLRSAEGFFSFQPSIFSAGDLTQTLASATTADGRPRQHPKLDSTKYVYNGRSYGVGAAVGLTDNFASTALGYTYQEVGYDAQTTCIYNQSTQFAIATDSYDGMNTTWIVSGWLPDSLIQPDGGGGEFNIYFGHGNGAIVSIGVTGNQHKGPQYLGIAAGWQYSFLNTTQCQTTYTPSLFEVNVGVAGKNITVSKIDSNTTDMEPTGNLIHITHRQISAYSDHSTSLYQSDVGNALDFSIADYRTSIANSNSENDIVLGGLTNSITAVIDDILSLYAGAQTMIQGDIESVPAIVVINAVRFGERLYILAIFLVNLAILLLVIAEAVRTKVWRDLTTFDYCDPYSMMYVASGGASTIRQEHDMVALAGRDTYTLVGNRSDRRDLELDKT